MQEKEILSLFESIRPLLKGLEKRESSFNPIYDLAIKQRDRIRVHAEDGAFPAELFKKRAPNQTDAEYDYLRENYKTITYPVWQAFQTLLNRIWVDQNWKIDYHGEEEVKQYLETDFPLYGSLEAFFRDIVTNQKELDNNGVIGVKPYYIPTIEKDGIVLVNDREFIDPYIEYYECQQVLLFNKDRHAFLLSHEKTLVQFGNTTVKEGLVIEFYDENSIYRFEQVGKKVDWQFNLILSYKHDLGYMPVWKLNGKAMQLEGEVFYKSEFMPAVANLDRAVLDDSYLNAKKAQVAYPHKWEYVSDCNYRDQDGNLCIDGIITHEEHSTKCPSCKGTGKQASVMGVTQVPMPTGFDMSKQAMSPPFLGFVEPSTDNLRFLREEIENYIAKAASMMKLDITETTANGSETATGDLISREETFALLKGISAQIFDLFEWSLDAIVTMRFLNKAKVPTVIPPRTFELRRDTDITQEITNLKAAGMPDIVIVQAMKEYMDIRFGLSIDSQQILDLATVSDRILTLTSDEILKKKAIGTIAPWEDILHTSMYYIVTNAMLEDTKFLEKSESDKIKVLQDKAKEMAKNLNPNPASTSPIIDNANA
jgi:hypothetical protein